MPEGFAKNSKREWVVLLGGIAFVVKSFIAVTADVPTYTSAGDFSKIKTLSLKSWMITS